MDKDSCLSWPMSSQRDQATLERELDEIELLLRQAGQEAERHEARRVQAEERVRRSNATTRSRRQLRRGADQLLTQTRRATLMQAQLDVLGGKQRTLQRFRDRLGRHRAADRAALAADDLPSAAPRRLPRRPRQLGASDVLAAQEQMRREIARQMHDGPAQSIANIALQAQIVQRLFEREPEQRPGRAGRAGAHGRSSALEATKAFIFDVRPMVLDDLGLVPTLRRSSLERGRRAGVTVRFESVGTDRSPRLRDLESALFRVIDDAMAGYLCGRARCSCGEARLDSEECDGHGPRPISRATFSHDESARHGRGCRRAPRTDTAGRTGLDDPRTGGATTAARHGGCPKTPARRSNMRAEAAPLP